MWYVLRFSEEQVVKHPESCCKYVAQFYASYGLNKDYLVRFRNIEDLSFYEQWNKETGNDKAANNFREEELGVERTLYQEKSYKRKRTNNYISSDKNDSKVDDLPF